MSDLTASSIHDARDAEDTRLLAGNEYGDRPSFAGATGRTVSATVFGFIREPAEAGDDEAHSVAEAFAAEE